MKSKDLELLRPQKETIIKYIKKNGVDKISLYSATTGLPLIAIYTFVFEDLPEHDMICKKKLKELREFYGEW